MTYAYELQCVLPASPGEVYDAWLSSEAHSEMTGGEAEMSDQVGAKFSAWDGYISGVNVELVPAKRIVQTWRTTQFGASDPDSTIEVTLAPDPAGCHLTLRHSGVPDGQTSYELGGWQNHYFEPMQVYFAAKGGAQSK